MIEIRQRLYGRDVWSWPEADTHIRRNFTSGPCDVEAAIEMVAPLLKGRRVCIQAGACLGVWPRRLAQVFEQVLTFEPCVENYDCAVRNLADVPNVTAFPAALGASAGECELDRCISEADNAGAFRCAEGRGVPVRTIDGLDLSACDLIYLDIEGAELAALQGARQTIFRFRPVIGFEHKFDRNAAIVGYLASLGYQVAGNPTRLDTVCVSSS